MEFFILDYHPANDWILAKFARFPNVGSGVRLKVVEYLFMLGVALLELSFPDFLWLGFWCLSA